MCFPKQKTDTIHGQVAGAVDELAFAQQIHQIVAHLSITELIGTAVIVERYAPDPVDLALAGREKWPNAKFSGSQKVAECWMSAGTPRYVCSLTAAITALGF